VAIEPQLFNQGTLALNDSRALDAIVAESHGGERRKPAELQWNGRREHGGRRCSRNRYTL